MYTIYISFVIVQVVFIDTGTFTDTFHRLLYRIHGSLPSVSQWKLRVRYVVRTNSAEQPNFVAFTHRICLNLEKISEDNFTAILRRD